MPEMSQLKNPKQAAFLAAYARLGTVTHAAQAADIDRREHYRWINDPDYEEAFKDAHEQAIDALEREAIRRATEGVDEPVFYQGEQCGAVRRYSDTLLIFLMKGANPEKYRDQMKIDANVNVGVLNERLLAGRRRVAEMPKQASIASPPKEIRVREKATGDTGYIPQNEFNPELYEEISDAV